MNEESDGALVRRTCSGEPRAFDALVRRHEKTVFNAALRMLHDREEARDVTQTVFLKVYEHLGEYDPTHKFYSWIYRIALNESIKSLQRRKPTAVPSTSRRPMARRAPRETSIEANSAAGWRQPS